MPRIAKSASERLNTPLALVSGTALSVKPGTMYFSTPADSECTHLTALSCGHTSEKRKHPPIESRIEKNLGTWPMLCNEIWSDADFDICQVPNAVKFSKSVVVRRSNYKQSNFGHQNLLFILERDAVGGSADGVKLRFLVDSLHYPVWILSAYPAAGSRFERTRHVAIRRPRSHPFTTLAAIVLVASQLALAQTATKPADEDFANKSIEELMNVPVSSVARKDQKLSKTPAAVYILTEEAIRRSGATIIPDLLRVVPGVQVAELQSNRWAISVRGFNGIYSDKLLVLVDGRTVYAPSFSGVYWDQLLEIPLDTIERIEVVRGPGASLWGANAMNGVINIITKPSAETQGTQIVTGGGSSQTGALQARYGGALGHWGTYRVLGQYDSFASRSGSRNEFCPRPLNIRQRRVSA